MRKTADTLPWVKPAANSASDPGILHHHTLRVNIFKMQDLPKNVHDQTVNIYCYILKYIYNLHPWVEVFLVFYVMNWYITAAGTNCMVVLSKVLVWLLGSRAEFATFLMNHHFYLKDLTSKLWIFKLGYLAETSLKMNRVNLSLQKRQNPTVSVANDKSWAFKQKL